MIADGTTAALAEALINGLWRGLALTAAVALLLRLTGRWTTPAERHSVWLATLAVIVGAPFVETALAVWPVEQPTLEAYYAPLLESRAATPASADFVVSHWVGAVLIGGWPVLALALLLRLWLRVRAAVRLKRASRAPAQEGVPSLTDWGCELPAGRSAETRSSAEAGTPLAVGWFRPAVLLPDVLRRRAAEAELHSLWLHEQAHIRRYDDWTQLLVAFVAAVFWFHPAVHWILARLEREREAACDAAVVEAGVAPNQYACALTRLAETVSARRPAAALGAAGRRSHLIRRVEMLMSDPRKSRRSAVRSTFACAAIAAAAVVWWASSAAPRAVLAQAPPEGPAASEPAPPAVPEPSPAPEPSPVPKPSPVPAPRATPEPPEAPTPPEPPDMSEFHEQMERLQLEMQPHLEQLQRMAQEIERIVVERIEPHREEIEKLAVEIGRRVEVEIEPLHVEIAARAAEIAERHSELTEEQRRQIESQMRELERRMRDSEGPLREMERQIRTIERETIRKVEGQMREVEQRMRQKEREVREVEQKMHRLEREEREQRQQREKREQQPEPEASAETLLNRAAQLQRAVRQPAS